VLVAAVFVEPALAAPVAVAVESVERALGVPVAEVFVGRALVVPVAEAFVERDLVVPVVVESVERALGVLEAEDKYEICFYSYELSEFVGQYFH